MKWEKLFKRHILERGYEYYQKGKVEILHYSEDTLEAVVSGTEDYNVSIGNTEQKLLDSLVRDILTVKEVYMKTHEDFI